MLCVAVSSRMEYGAVDTLGTILFVNQTLIPIDNHYKVIVVGNWQAGLSLHLLAIEIHGVFPTKVGDSVINPFAVPPIVSHLFLKLLSRQEGAPEDVWSALRIRYIRREEDFSVWGARMNNRAINGLTGNWDFGNACFPQFPDCFLCPLVRQVWKRLLDQSKQHLVIVAVNNKVR